MASLKDKLTIDPKDLEAVNVWLKKDPFIDQILAVVEKFGGVEEINREAAKSMGLDNVMARLRKENNRFVKDLEWLMKMRDEGAFITYEEYVKTHGGPSPIPRETAVTLEISALNNMEWLIDEAKHAIEHKELMPSRYILVRPMKEQEEVGELLALVAAMDIIGANTVETLDTKGTLPTAPDGGPANVHLGGPETIAGYFGGVGQPNDFVLKWAEEFLYYYKNYGIKQVLNVNPGTVLVGYLLHKIGIDIEFKISVFMGNDNPGACLWTLMAAKLFSRDDGTTSLIGFNLSNSVNVETLKAAHLQRHEFGFDKVVRFEHHITEPSHGIVRQPYHRLDDLLELAKTVPNISAKHEGGVPEVEKAAVESGGRDNNILDYFMPAEKREEMDKDLRAGYLMKHNAVQVSAVALTKAGVACIPATRLHKY